MFFSWQLLDALLQDCWKFDPPEARPTPLEGLGEGET